MQLRSWVAWVAGVTVLAWSIVAVVQAQTVTSSDITDAVPSSFVDAATTTPDPAAPLTVSPVAVAPERSRPKARSAAQHIDDAALAGRCAAGAGPPSAVAA